MARRSRHALAYPLVVVWLLSSIVAAHIPEPIIAKLARSRLGSSIAYLVSSQAGRLGE